MKALFSPVTILVTSILCLLGTTQMVHARTDMVYGPPAPEDHGAVTFTMKDQGQQTVEGGASPYAFVSVSLEYQFYKTYALTLDTSYYRSFENLSQHGEYGINDVALSLADKELWTNKYYGLTLKASTAVILPSSHASKMAGMLVGGGGMLNLKKMFSDRFWLSYALSDMNYAYTYNTALETEDVTVYNTRIVIANKVLTNYDALKDLHLNAGASLLTYNNTNGDTYNTYIVFTGISYDVTKEAALDLGVRSGYKSEFAPATWNGPTTSDKFLGSEGTTVYLGMTLKI